MAREHLLVVGWRGWGGGGGGGIEKSSRHPNLFSKNYIYNNKRGGRPTRLLPHAKILLMPIELFLSARQIMLWKVLHLY